MFSDFILRATPTCAPAVPPSDLETVLDSAQPRPSLVDGLLFDHQMDEAMLTKIIEADGNATVMLDQSPWNWVPIAGNGTVTRPAQHQCSLREAVEQILSPQRRHHAYIRHQSLAELPALRRLLESWHAMRVVGKRVQMRNLWLGDGGLSSGLHFDSVDNLLIQLSGEKRVLLLPPRLAPELGYAPLEERRYAFDGETFHGVEKTGAAPLENFTPLRVGALDWRPDLFSGPLAATERKAETRRQRLSDALAARAGMMSGAAAADSWSKRGALLCHLVPGQALFIPALWSHAVQSSASTSSPVGGAESKESREEQCDTDGNAPAVPKKALNAALNVWYVRNAGSVRAALSAGLDTFAPAHAAHGLALRELGRYAEAASAYDRALTLRRPPEPAYVDATRGLGAALLDGNVDIARARGVLRSAVAMRPADASSHAELGRALRASGRLGEAAASYATSHALRPHDVGALASLASVHALDGRAHEAAALFARAVALAPTDAATRHAQAHALDDAGRAAEALAAFRGAARLRPEWREARGDLRAAEEREARRAAIKEHGGWSWQLERTLRQQREERDSGGEAPAPAGTPTPTKTPHERELVHAHEHEHAHEQAVGPAKQGATVGDEMNGREQQSQAATMDGRIQQYSEGRGTMSTPTCRAYFLGDRRAAARLEATDGGLQACADEFRRATALSDEGRAPPPRATGQRPRSPEAGREAAGSDSHPTAVNRPQRWDESRCSRDRTEGVAAACEFSARAWRVGTPRRGSWDADLEQAAVLASPDALRTAQVVSDARELRFVRFDCTLLARGVASAAAAPGMDALPYHSYAMQQGLHMQLEHGGLPLMKMAWDLPLLSMALAELRPRTILELGTGSGASAMWLADEAIKLGLVEGGGPDGGLGDGLGSSAGPGGGPGGVRVHTFDIKSAETIAAAHGVDAQTWLAALRSRGVTFHGGADLSDAQAALPAALLAELPHPWLVLEDSHAGNTLALLRHLFSHLRPGDYMVVEDIRFASRKRRDWFAFLQEAGDRAALDLRYLDFFGVNANCAPDGWVKVLA